ncbi:MAG: hypothetical protein QOG52_243 [Frankiaceae bacterium]|nr:hypothetical protein [Frankiaceae bacterium]
MTLTRLARIASVVGVSVCLAVTPAFAATAPVAVDPPGTVSLAADESVPARTTIVGASDEWVAYGSGPYDNRTYHATSLRDGHTVDLGGFGDRPYLTGAMVVVPHVDQLEWTDLDTGESGTALFPRGRFAGATPTGWLLLAGPTGAAFIDARSGAVTPVGLPAGSQVVAAEVQFGPSGVVLRTKVAQTSIFIAYNSPATATSLAVRTGGCNFVTAPEIACGGYYTVRLIPLDGSAVRSWPVAEPAYLVAVTATRVGWNDPDGLFHTSDTDGQNRLDSTGPIDVQAATSQGFLYVGGSSAADAGIYLLPDIGATPTEVVSLGAGVVRADTIALGPGRVAWIDNASSTRAVWSERVGAHAAQVVAGPRELLATAPTSRLATRGYLAVSGTRTVYGSLSDLYLNDGGKTTTIWHTTDTAARSPSVNSIQLSGTRLLVDHDYLTTIIDVRTRAVLYSVKALLLPVLRGDFLVYTQVNGAIWRKNLVTGVLTQVQSAQGKYVYTQKIKVEGDYVAWQGTGAVRYRNARTRTAIVTLPRTEYLVGLSGAGVVTAQFTGSQSSLLFRRYGSRIATTIGTTKDVGSAVIDGAVIAWIDSTGLPKVAPLPGGSGRAQLLGRASASRITSASGSWTGEWDASAPLTSCSVLFISGRTTVRTVACDAAAMAVGVAAVTWDGRTRGGRAVTGTVAWRLVAANSAGSVLREDGAIAPITGTLVAR